MSLKENQVYLENTREDFYTYLKEKDWEKCEKVAEDLKVNGFVDEGLNLEAELEEEIELDKATNGDWFDNNSHKEN